MRSDREIKERWAVAAGVALGDPIGWLCALILFGSYWKITLIFLAVVLTVGLITGLLMLWVNRWDI